MTAITCDRCGGDIEYVTEETDSGDGPWAQSGYVAFVLWERCDVNGAPSDDPGGYGKTTCGCVWPPQQLDELDELATKAEAK